MPQRLREFILSSLFLMVASSAFAFDHLEITVVNPRLAQGLPSATVDVPISVRVRAVNADNSTDLTADFINAELYSPDVPATLPPSNYLTNGERQFDNLVFRAEGQPIRLRVRDADDGSVPNAEVLINCYNSVDRFSMSVPVGDKFVNTPINVNVTALDANGSIVYNFGDDVYLDALVGDFNIGPIVTVPGSSYANGQASLNVVFWGTDPLTRENQLTATNSITYPGQPSPATGTIVVTPLRPGPLATVVLLLPGETLTPGVSPGKIGTPTPQVSGNPFNGVDVYATDQHWNPVESGPYPTLNWSSDDPSPGVNLPPNGVMPGNAALDLTAELIQAGPRRVTINTTGPISATSESFVVLNPEGLDHFVFNYTVWDTTDIQVTTIPFQLRVRAEDSNNNLFPFNGQVTIRALLGTSDESEDYVIVDNTNFVNGILNANLQVTKRAFSARVIVDNNGSVVGTSGSFQVNSGPLNRILITWPGQTWVPGLNDTAFSGNVGTPNATIAGQQITMTVRPVDRYANIVSGLRNVSISSPTGYFELPAYPNNLITLSNPVDVNVILRTYQGQALTADASGVNPNNSGTVFVSPASYAHVVVEAPGETLDPGIFDSIEDDGKIGSSSIQDAGVPFTVRVYGTDLYWNPITDQDPVLPLSADFSSSDAAAGLPSNPQQLADNSSDFLVSLITLADPNQQTIRVDDNGSAVWGVAIIPVKAGTIDHFDIGINNGSNPTPADFLQPIPDHQAGSSLPNVTIIARDVFNNHVADYADSISLYVNHGNNILVPSRISMANGFGSGNYRGSWRGPITISKAGSGVRLFAREDLFAKTDSSNAFTVFSGPYADLVLLLPGETHTPGIAPGKVGTPLPSVAGSPVRASVQATDAWWNPIPSQPAVHFASNSYFQMISANDQILGVNGSRNFDLLFKTATVQTLTVSDLIQPSRNDRTDILVTAGPFDRLMLVAPGETPQPGGPESDGKTGTPLPRTASLEFNLVARSVDQYWNQVDNSTEHIHLASDDNSLTPTNPVNNDQSLVNGALTFPVFLISTGYITLNVTALDNTDLQGQSVTIPVEQGAQYQILVPATAFVGPPSTFSMTISLVDSLGNPLADANNWVDIKALKSNLEPASSTIFVNQAQLQAGSVTLNNQAYNTVEDIVLQISDASGRLSYSGTIQMVPNGLEYVVTVDTDPVPIAGPPRTFPVQVRLQDTDTQTVIQEDRPLAISVLNALGTPGLGAISVANHRLDRGSVTFQQSYTRAENIYITVTDSTGLSGSSPVFSVVADGYKRLQIVAPGEIVQPGVDFYSTLGKSGTPISHRSGEQFPLTVRAVDQYWNLADSTNVGLLRLVASDNSFTLPGNPNVNYVPFVNGRRTFTGFLTDEGTVTVTTYDENNLAKPEQSVAIPVDPPYQYEITVPATATTGPNPGFLITVKLVDPVTGNVVPLAQNRIHLTALRANLAVANGTLGITESQLIDGVAVINESYSTVENIIIRVSDDFGRETYSTVIQMDTGGLYYSVTLPDSAVVGPPASFPLTVELLDSNTGERVTTQDRVFNIQVLSASTGNPGTGSLGIMQGQLSAGIVGLSETYTKAEDIFLQLSDASGVTGLSNTCTMLADGFKRIQIVAPGETPNAGALTGNGRLGAPLTQQAEVPFSITLRAVDQYFNMATPIVDGSIALSSSGGSLDVVDPVDANAPFINGSRDIEIILGDPGLIAVFAIDTTRPSVSTGRVDIPVNEAEYRIVLPTPAVVTAGPPSTFGVTVRLVNPLTQQRIAAGNDFTMQAVRPDRSPASGALGITSGTLVSGEAVVTGQNYATSEDIVIRVTDARGREAFSDVLSVVPVGVTWSLVTPDSVVAGEPWSMQIRRIDIVTGQLVTSADRSFTLRAFSGNQSRPDWNLTPAGVLADSLGTTSGGQLTFASQSYDRAEGIFLELTDFFGEKAYSGTIVVLPNVPEDLSLAATEPNGTPLLRAVRPNEQLLLEGFLTDAYGNALVGQSVRFDVLNGDAALGSARVPSVVGPTSGAGIARVSLWTTTFARRDANIQAYYGPIQSNVLLIDITGPPLTVVSFDPPASAYLDGYYLSPNTRIILTATTEDPGGIQAVFRDVDVVDPPLPAAVYSGPFSLADLGITNSGSHTLRFFAEEASGTREGVQSVVLYTTQDLATNRPVTNRPNPFRAGKEPTIILFQPPANGRATLTIYDLFGGEVFSTQLDATEGTLAQFVWDGRSGKGNVIANGGYILRVTGPGYELRRKIAVVK
jgi:hypothetical protein